MNRARQPSAVVVSPSELHPIPLLNQVQQPTPGRIDITYLERGPVGFRVQFIAVS